MKLKYIPVTILFFSILACNSDTNRLSAQLNSNDKLIQDSFKIDPSVIADLRDVTDSSIHFFPYSEFRFEDTTIDVSKFPRGFIFNQPHSTSASLVLELDKKYFSKGYSIFMVDNNFGMNNEPDIIGVLKTTDKYEILRTLYTNGINWEIDNDSLINIVKQFDTQLDLKLVAADFESCEFIINKPPKNWLQLAKNVYKVCPDVVDQGAETVEALAQEMKKTNRLYFWWD